MQYQTTHYKGISQVVEDVKVIAEDAARMVELCKLPLARYPSAYAISHCQITHEEPKRFFVTFNGERIINPEILERSGKCYSKEGCMTFPFRSIKKVRRWRKVKVKYQDMEGKETEKEVEDLEAFIFQHEIDHFNGICIYDKK